MAHVRRIKLAKIVDGNRQWKKIAELSYGLGAVVLVESRKHFGEHFFLESGGTRYVLSRSPIQIDRMEQLHQFKLIAHLRREGFLAARLPIPAADGRYAVSEEDAWWTLWSFTEGDDTADWTDPGLIGESARVLVDLHRAGRGFAPESQSESDRPDLGWYYLPSRRWVGKAPEIARKFAWDRLDPTDSDFVASELETVCRDNDRVAAYCRREGLISIAHQDYRPENLCVRGGSIVEVWDFDMAVIDFCLYDVAFAALQFGGRECLFADISLDLAGVFVAAYIDAARIGGLYDEPEIFRWFLRVAVLRRLLLNYHVPERVELLRLVSEWDWVRASRTVQTASRPFIRIASRAAPGAGRRR